MTFGIYPIVEGHGEVLSLPLVLRRILSEVYGIYDFVCFYPHRLPRGKMSDPEELGKAVELGVRRVQGVGSQGGVLVLLDADDDCPVEVASVISEIGEKRAGGRCLFQVTVANREFEAWFLSAILSLRGVRGVKSDAEPPHSPEAIRGAKEFLKRELMVTSATYSPTVDQAALASKFDLCAAARARSFEKIVKVTGELAGVE